MHELTLRHLAADELRDAFALASVMTPGVGEEQWRSYGEGLIEAGGGILGIFGGGVALHGFAAYRVHQTLRHGRALAVEYLITFEFSRAAPARTALVEGLELLAFGLDCAAVTVRLCGAASAAAAGEADRWHQSGFEPAGLILAKTLRRDPAAGLRSPRLVRAPGTGRNGRETAMQSVRE